MLLPYTIGLVQKKKGIWLRETTFVYPTIPPLRNYCAPRDRLMISLRRKEKYRYSNYVSDKLVLYVQTPFGLISQ